MVLLNVLLICVDEEVWYRGCCFDELMRAGGGRGSHVLAKLLAEVFVKQLSFGQCVLVLCQGEEVMGCVLVRRHAELVHETRFICGTQLLQNVDLACKPLDWWVSLCYSLAQQRNAVRPVLLRNDIRRLRSTEDKVSIVNWRRNYFTGDGIRCWIARLDLLIADAWVDNLCSLCHCISCLLSRCARAHVCDGIEAGISKHLFRLSTFCVFNHLRTRDVAISPVARLHIDRGACTLIRPLVVLAGRIWSPSVYVVAGVMWVTFEDAKILRKDCWCIVRDDRADLLLQAIARRLKKVVQLLTKKLDLLGVRVIR